jgi:hypothetical protein
MPRGFCGHLRGRKLSQFVIDERKQVRGGLTVAFLDRFD